MLGRGACGREWHSECREGIGHRKEKRCFHHFSLMKGGQLSIEEEAKRLGDGMMREFPFHVFQFLNQIQMRQVGAKREDMRTLRESKSPF